MKTTVTQEKELTFEEAKNEFVANMEPSQLMWYGEEEIDVYIGENIPYEWELTDEEIDDFTEKMVPIIKPMWIEEKNRCRAEESELLSCREDIIEWIGDVMYTIEPQEGMVGYTLSPEEILDLMLKNGTKNRS